MCSLGYLISDCFTPPVQKKSKLRPSYEHLDVTFPDRRFTQRQVHCVKKKMPVGGMSGVKEHGAVYAGSIAAWTIHFRQMYAFG